MSRCCFKLPISTSLFPYPETINNTSGQPYREINGLLRQNRIEIIARKSRMGRVEKAQMAAFPGMT